MAHYSKVIPVLLDCGVQDIKTGEGRYCVELLDTKDDSDWILAVRA